jgi:hypothetical protein
MPTPRRRRCARFTEGIRRCSKARSCAGSSGVCAVASKRPAESPGPLCNGAEAPSGVLARRFRSAFGALPQPPLSGTASREGTAARGEPWARSRKTRRPAGSTSGAGASRTTRTRCGCSRASTPRLRDLQTWLGEDHNHALLRAAILAAPDRFGDASTTAVVLGCIAKHQSWLRGHALRLGHRLFSAKPADFRKSVGSWWPKGS